MNHCHHFLSRRGRQSRSRYYSSSPFVNLQRTLLQRQQRSIYNLLSSSRLDNDHNSSAILTRHFSSQHQQPQTPPPKGQRSDSKEEDDDPDKTELHAQEESPSQHVWNQLQSPPNIITLSRIASTPILSYWICSEQYQLALGGVIVASISDWLDGYLAKHHGMATVVGSYLDPIADKVMVNVLGVSLWYSGVLPTPLILIWATKDALLLSGTAYNVYQRHNSFNILKTATSGHQTFQVTPTTLGKASTLFQFSTLAVGVSTPVLGIFSPAILDSLW